jgi:hypothetical protein
MPLAGFEPAIPAGERLQTHALDRSATRIGYKIYIYKVFISRGSVEYEQLFLGFLHGKKFDKHCCK